MNIHERNAAFRRFLDGLNPAQRLAVERTEGPVLVIAGPGTGKTHLLSARVGKILLDTDTRPQNILCLTFTDAGVSAMRQRLFERIGPEAHRVPIQTFHAFCNRIIQENLELFGRTSLEPLTELERIEMVRQLLVQLPHDHPLREGQKDIFQYERHLRDLFANMKKEGWTPGLILKRVDAYLAGLSENPDFIYQRNTKHAKKGEPKRQQIEEVTERMTRLRAAADLYPRYQNALERAGRYEYEDMLLWVLRVFERNTALLRNYQERFLYVLVDEYQDTNGAQNQLLSLLLDYWESPNIFIVGDDDQSIYEFQGARLQNLLDFHRTYRADLLTVVLEENYRSTQGILDAAHRVIGHNTLRAIHSLDEPLNKDLRAQRREQQAPILRVYENRLHEVADIVAQIESLIQNGTPPREIAVLYARHKQANRLLALLEKKGIAYQTRRPMNLLDLPWMQQFRSLLHYLYDESQRPFSGEGRLFRLLHAAFFDLSPLDLARVSVLLRPVHSPGSDRRPRSWREVLADEPALQALRLQDYVKLVTTARQFEAWIAELHNLPLPALIEKLYNQSGLLAYALAQADKIWWLQSLNTFLDFVQAETGRHPRFSLGRLLAVLDSMDDNRLALPVQQPLRMASDGVQLFTAHGSKGLEFEHVFMLDCTDDLWGKSATGQRGRFTLPATLTLSGEEDALEARRRLFYVAMTRAKRHLQISYSRFGEDGKPLVQAVFVEETGLPKTEAPVPVETLLETQTLLLLESAQPVITLPEPALIDELLRSFSLSVRSLNRYLRCPLAFYYTDLLRIPETMSEAACFGEAMHGTLQQFFFKMKMEGQNHYGTAAELVRLFAEEMERRRGFFGEASFAHRVAFGKELLRRYHADQIPQWRYRAVVEQRLDRVELDGVPLVGTLDKVEWLDDRSLRIVDYKTGTPDATKTAAPNQKQPYGGDYWRQLAFYKILLEQAQVYAEPVSTTAVSWLEPDRKGRFPVVELSFSGADIQFVGQLIRETYAKIMAREFTRGCGQEDCVWCRMHRDRQLPMGFDRTAEEELDDA